MIHDFVNVHFLRDMVLAKLLRIKMIKFEVIDLKQGQVKQITKDDGIIFLCYRDDIARPAPNLTWSFDFGWKEYDGVGYPLK